VPARHFPLFPDVAQPRSERACVFHDIVILFT